MLVRISVSSSFFFFFSKTNPYQVSRFHVSTRNNAPKNISQLQLNKHIDQFQDKKKFGLSLTKIEGSAYTKTVELGQFTLAIGLSSQTKERVFRVAHTSVIIFNSVFLQE
ncbi:unnamed protein product [Trifolium pratense]|uniref:Uncharacterized protein n=1 Tax=Trifolium pratense TaxID=57577 RepID=A0ACB0L0M4_TRIPR|nr:unnamed protein product [Trifolium pratense]